MQKLLAVVMLIVCLFSFAQAEEVIIADPDNGFWSYTSDTFSVTITRVHDTEQKLIWYECDLYCSPESPLMAVSSNPKKPGSKLQKPEKISRDNHLVFAINDDFFGDRVFNDEKVGIIVRHGSLLYKSTYKSGTRKFPNLDTMAFFPDGSIAVFDSKEHTGDEYIAMGATDVFAFGPWLLRGGELNPMLQKVGTSVQPRVAIGMVEPYHYKVLLVEGRHKNSKGVSCEWMACKMLDMGCTVAFNLDGGQTSALMFMGVKINTSGSYQGRSGYRTLSGMIGAGVSEQVPPFKD